MSRVSSGWEPYAVLDVGSNTIRLLVARPQQGELEQLLDLSEFVRLGLGVDKTGELRPDRKQAALEAIETLANRARSVGAKHIVAFATSAVRDAANGEDFIRRVKETAGVEVEIISGDREAYLTFLGATMGLDIGAGAIICDLGGGSAELIHADASGMRWATSEPLGSGRLTERFVHHDPPTPEEHDQLAAYVRSVLQRLPRPGTSLTPRRGGVPAAQVELAVFTGGTATHVAIIAGLQGTVETTVPTTLDRVVDILTSHPASEIVSRYNIKEERAKVLPAGAMALQTIAQYYHADRIVISRHGIREGAILDSLDRAST